MPKRGYKLRCDANGKTVREAVADALAIDPLAPLAPIAERFGVTVDCLRRHRKLLTRAPTGETIVELADRLNITIPTAAARAKSGKNLSLVGYASDEAIPAAIRIRNALVDEAKKGSAAAPLSVMAERVGVSRGCLWHHAKAIGIEFPLVDRVIVRTQSGEAATDVARRLGIGVQAAASRIKTGRHLDVKGPAPSASEMNRAVELGGKTYAQVAAEASVSVSAIRARVRGLRLGEAVPPPTSPRITNSQDRIRAACNGCGDRIPNRLASDCAPNSVVLCGKCKS